MALKVDYVNAQLDTDVQTQRTFDVVNSSGGTVYSNIRLNDTTTYKQVGDTYGASDINNANVLAILNNGFPTQTKTFSDDGTTITATSGDTDTLGWTLTKVFTDSFLTCTTTLKDAGENIKATLIKQFSADGKTISTVYNYEG